MKIVYQASSYKAENVTGRYVRCNGRKGGYIFRVFETASGTGRFAGKAGHGPTLREYDTSGDELPEVIREHCITSKQTERWD